MAITVPDANTPVSVSGWGKPITDQVNLLSLPKVIAGKQQNITQSGIGNGVWANVTGMSISFTAKANWLYEIGWQANLSAGPTSGLWMACGLQVDGTGQPGRYVTAVDSSTGSASGYGMTCFGSQYTSAKLGGVLTAGVHSFQLQVTASGAALNVDGGAPCYIYVVDWGSDT